MCPRCEKIMGLWKAKPKGRRKVNLLALEVPQHLQEVTRYFDPDRGTMIYVLECNHCGQTFHVPH